MGYEKLSASRHAALGDEVRLSIVKFASESDRTVNEIREYLEIVSPLLAHHLDVLESVGLISRSKSAVDARKRFVSVRHENLPQFESPKIPKRVVFVCTENIARSQLASAIWHGLIGENASCGGTKPGETIHALTIESAEQNGFKIKSRKPRQVSTRDLEKSTVITVCDSAYAELGASNVDAHWSILDPVQVGTKSAFNKTIKQLEQRIQLYKGAIK